MPFLYHTMLAVTLSPSISSAIKLTLRSFSKDGTAGSIARFLTVGRSLTAVTLSST